MAQDMWNLETGDEIVRLPNGGSLVKRRFLDPRGMPMTAIELSNGKLSFSVLPERGMDIGEISLGPDLMSWERSKDYLLHPSNVDLQEAGGTGWLYGFYGAVASIGPELFGTPGEGFSLHGSGSYSLTVPSSVQVTWNTEGIRIEGRVVVRDESGEASFVKYVIMRSRWNSAVLLREEHTTNVSMQTQVVDDGYHVQLSGTYLHQGGRYVLPVHAHEMLLRDMAPPEADPFEIPSIEAGKYPIRCYQYVPRPVKGLHQLEELAPYLDDLDASRGVTAEMIVNTANTGAGFVIRPLLDFPRSLIAKEINDSFMFALEPSKTRPNRMSQKKTDGEALYVQPEEEIHSQCLIGLSRSTQDIVQLESIIRSTVKPES
ncbi:DUF4432 family protein [Paenibacillus sp. PR3]|uniref:DUF4432 family protein n=1 Tax=Paenibacillus terricola TaxID=2763503 RepID=A0ABR8MVU7_9BACL|nr:DUF4432 family protein [Paenibacillus terricola]MBD3920090.1 DUF4432 family protein [Paenibacillus terricola]